MGAMTIVAMPVSRANRAGSSFSRAEWVQPASGCQQGARDAKGVHMPKGRSTFAKRQKEHARQQRQRDKAERRNQRKQEKTAGSADELGDLREHAAEQAALFNLGTEDADTAEHSSSGDHAGE